MILKKKFIENDDDNNKLLRFLVKFSSDLVIDFLKFSKLKDNVYYYWRKNKVDNK